MRAGLLAAALASTVTIASPVRAQDEPGLAPISGWTLDYAADSCALRRMFGEGKNRAYLEFRRFGPGLGLQTTIASSRMTATRWGSFSYRFGNEGDWREVTGANAITMNGDFRGYSGVLFDPVLVNLPEYEKIEDPLARAAYLKNIDLRAVEMKAASETDSITLRGAFRKRLTLQLGSLDKPIAALQTCIDELMTHWGIDVEAHKSLTRPAIATNLAEVPRMMDYPPKMIQQSLPGVVNIRLGIDERGLITACHIQMPLSDPEFEKSSCADIEHALEFEPALDKDGKPIPSYWVTRVVFRLN
jgi:hypothetical protein